MLRSSQLTKCVTIAMTIAALGTSTASARPADSPRYHEAVAHSAGTTQWTQPRIDSPGIRPVVRATSAAQPIPLVQPATESAFDWLSALIGASALLCLFLLVIIARSIHAPHRGRIAPPSA
jgi:hypothetical protein